MTEATTELLAGAQTAFSDAVHALISLRPDTIDRDGGPEHIVRGSLYRELLEARHGERIEDTLVRSAPASTAPGWTDAMSLVIRIDQRVAVWWPEIPAGTATVPVTVRRLYALVDYQWRPQDVGELRRMEREVLAWVARARVLLPTEATHMWELRAACPACGETMIHADDGSGEQVRRYVLQADRSSARCIACETTWAPEHFAALARLIGAGLPEGVLE
ncbi:hypothetical protein [Nocardia sp. NPDC004860]|uniref:DUF7341 domain-containing protein n=1 Tax=Nocardia sp. NPDC004860 TaxID=3154557 RepID=UPI0033BFB5A9